jgi:DNA-binding NtrC family response regulator
METKAVLIVDDEVDICDLFRVEFESRGHAVTTAHSVTEARLSLLAGRFDIIVTDITMPDGSGLDLLKDARNSATRIFLMSAYARITEAEAVQRGARRLFSKPLNFVQTTDEILSAT